MFEMKPDQTKGMLCDPEAQREALDHINTVSSQLRRSLPLVARRQTEFLQSVAAGVTTMPAARSGAASIEERFLQRSTFGWNLALQDQVEQRGWKAVLEEQLDPENIDDFGLEQALLDALPSLSQTPIDRLQLYRDNLIVPFIELALAVFLRALYSPRQLFERTVELWNDHLHTAFLADLGAFFKADYDFAIRRQAMADFRSLLGASARGPAMLDYLTNNTNVKSFPNENYARELMELHTLGVDAGYTQDDVKEVARAFTGWTFIDERDPFNTFGYFTFLRRDHDIGPKTVLGVELAADRGVEDGEQVLDILAAHPNCARFIARKILVQFWGYQPTQRQIDSVASVYEQTNGDIRALLRRVLSWYDLTTAPPKLKRPFHLVTSALRALFAGVDNAGSSLFFLLQAGHFPFFWSPPNGYPDSEGYWSGSPLLRWNYANSLLLDDPGLDYDLSIPRQAQNGEQLIFVLDQLLLGGTLAPATREALVRYIAARGGFDDSAAPEVLGLITASPEFQYY